MHPGGSVAPLLRATWILPSATTVVAESITRGGPSPVGTADAIGLVRRTRSAPPGRKARPPSFDAFAAITSPTEPARAARPTTAPNRPVWLLRQRVTAPTPT